MDTLELVNTSRKLSKALMLIPSKLAPAPFKAAEAIAAQHVVEKMLEPDCSQFTFGISQEDADWISARVQEIKEFLE